MPVRRIPPSRRAITGRLAAQKSIGHAHYESALERDFLITLEADPNVEAYETQPLTLHYLDSLGHKRKYTPDVLVFRAWGVTELCEVKYLSDIQALRLQHKERWVSAFHHAKVEGWRFRLITEHHARTVRTRNWLFLSTYRVMDFSQLHLEHLQSSLTVSGSVSIADWLEQHPQPNAELLPAVWHLLCLGRVGVDLDQPLSLDSFVTPLGGTHA